LHSEQTPQGPQDHGFPKRPDLGDRGRGPAGTGGDFAIEKEKWQEKIEKRKKEKRKERAEKKEKRKEIRQKKAKRKRKTGREGKCWRGVLITSRPKKVCVAKFRGE